MFITNSFVLRYFGQSLSLGGALDRDGASDVNGVGGGHEEDEAGEEAEKEIGRLHLSPLVRFENKL